MFWMDPRKVSLALVAFLPSSAVFGQIVQLPTMGTFSISGGALVPDSGAAYLGGSGRAIGGGSRQPVASAYGGSRGAGGASIHTTIIDLDELDRMIRSETQAKPGLGGHRQFQPNTLAPKSTKVQPDSLQSRAKHDTPPSYAYLMAMSHSPVDDRKAIDDAKYYLNLAEEARRKQRWSTVEMYYTQAWKSLPEGRRDSAMKALLEARKSAAALEEQNSVPNPSVSR
jgi:hypothetical protein